MPEGLRLIVTTDVTQAEAGLKKFVATAGKEGQAAAASLSKGLNKVNPAATKTFSNLSTQAKIAIKPISALGDSIETLRAKLLVRKDLLVTATDIGKIQIYNTEIKALEAEITRLGNVGSTSLGAVGKAGTKAFSFLRTAAQILPGIGIAGIFGLAFEGIGSLFDAIGGKSSELSKKLKELIVPIQDIKDAATAGTAEELSKVTALSNAVLNQALSYKERNAALNQLKEINKGYFGDLTVETAALGLLKDRVEEYTKAIIAQAVIKAFSDEIGKLAVELSKQEKAFNDAGHGLDAYKKNLNKVTTENTDNIKGIQGVSTATLDAQNAVAGATTKFKEQGAVVSKLRNQMFQLRNTIQEVVNESLSLKPLDEKTPKPTKEKRVIEFIPKFVVADRGTLQTGLQKMFDNIQGLFIPELHIRKTDGEKMFDELKKEISSKAAIQPIPIPINLVVNAEQLQKQMNDINAIIGKGFADLFAGIGEGIATGNFTGITDILGDVIIQIGKALIQYGVVKEGLDKILKAGIAIPGTIAIIAGIAAVAIGTLIKNAKPQGFFEGGFTGSGSPHDIAGVVHKNEFVLSANMLKGLRSNNVSQPNLSGLLGGGSQVVVLKTVISGNAIALVDARTSKSQKRLGI